MEELFICQESNPTINEERINWLLQDLEYYCEQWNSEKIKEIQEELKWIDI